MLRSPQNLSMFASDTASTPVPFKVIMSQRANTFGPKATRAAKGRETPSSTCAGMACPALQPRPRTSGRPWALGVRGVRGRGEGSGRG